VIGFSCEGLQPGQHGELTDLVTDNLRVISLSPAGRGGVQVGSTDTTVHDLDYGSKTIVSLDSPLGRREGKTERTVNIGLLPFLGGVLELLEVSLDRVGSESTPSFEFVVSSRHFCLICVGLVLV
jgi:hypothetical protein